MRTSPVYRMVAVVVTLAVPKQTVLKATGKPVSIMMIEITFHIYLRVTLGSSVMWKIATSYCH